MIAKNFSLLFYPKKGKRFIPSEPQPIYMRITVDGIPREISVGRKWPLDRWNIRAGRAMGTKEVKALNAYLDTFQTKVYEARRQLMEGGKEISAEAIKNILTGGGKEKPRMLMQIFRQHNEQMKPW